VKRLHLLLLDANIVIYLFKLGLWEKVVDLCEVHISEIVKSECRFYEDVTGKRCTIDLTPMIANGDVKVFKLMPSEITSFLDRFSIGYIEKLDPGETETLAFLLNSEEKYTICASDQIVFRVLGALNRSEQGISLEEVLKSIGLNRKLLSQFTKTLRKQWTDRGFAEGLQGLAKKKLP